VAMFFASGFGADNILRGTIKFCKRKGCYELLNVAF